MRQTCERITYIVFVILAFLSYCVTVVANYFSATADNPPFYFNASIGDMSDKYELDITPSSLAFSIWGVIYVWEGALLVYGLSTVFRRGVPEVLTPEVCTFYILARGANIGWIIFFLKEWINWGALMIFGYCLLMYAAMFFSYRRYGFCLTELQRRWKADLWAIRILVHNGFAVGTTWVSIATLLNVAMSLFYHFHLSMASACTIALALLLTEGLIWYVLENFCFDRYLRYTWTIWPVVMWALGNSIRKNWDETESNSILTAYILCMVVVLFTIRVLKVLFGRRCYRSVHSSDEGIDMNADAKFA